MGNLIYRELPNGEKQYFQYDTENQLTRAEIKKPQGNTEIWEYAYDPFGRRLSKERKDKLAWVSTAPKRTHFVWDGTRLLQEYTYKGNYTYLYTDQDSYEPLAQVFYNRKDDKQYLSYYHTDQIGIPREMTDQFGNLLWFGEYTAWGCLKEQTKVYPNAHQPFRLQNQYYDQETGLHYNLMRYYEPDTGRFVNQDPIGLVGGDNFYQFAPNAQEWIDPWGWKRGKSQSFDSWVKGKKSDTHVYIGCRDGKAVYVGIAKDIPKRQKQHDGKNRNFKLIALTDSAMNRGFARSIEQSIINSNPKFENSINSISPKRALYKDAVAWGDDWMKENIKGGVSSLCPEAKKKGKSKCKK